MLMQPHQYQHVSRSVSRRETNGFRGNQAIGLNDLTMIHVYRQNPAWASIHDQVWRYTLRDSPHALEPPIFHHYAIMHLWQPCFQTPHQHC